MEDKFAYGNVAMEQPSTRVVVLEGHNQPAVTGQHCDITPCRIREVQRGSIKDRVKMPVRHHGVGQAWVVGCRGPADDDKVMALFFTQSFCKHAQACVDGMVRRAGHLRPV